MFISRLDIHYQRIKNKSDEVLSQGDGRIFDTYIELTSFPFNCDVQKADKSFKAEVLKSDIRIQEAFKKEMSDMDEKGWLQQIAGKDLLNSIFLLSPCGTPYDAMIAQREGFDLKANLV